MNDNAIKTVANALKKSVAGETVTSVKMTAAPHAGLGGGSGEKKTDTVTVPTGPFSFDYTKLDELRKAYNAKDDKKLAELLPDNTTFAYRQEITDEELQNQAKEYAEGRYEERVDVANDSADQEINALNEKLRTQSENAATKIGAAVETYETGTEGVKDSTVRQGIVRSSIYDGLMAKLTDALNAERDRIESALAATTENITVQMAYVEKERERALKNYELKKAEEYEKQLDKLRSEEYAARKEVVAYNKEIAEWKQDIAKARRSYAEQIIVDAGKKGLYAH